MSNEREKPPGKPIPFPGTLNHAITPGYGLPLNVNPMEGVRFGVLAAPGTEVPGRTNCNHPADRRREGERTRLHYGSSATEECTLCSAWRQVPREPGMADMWCYRWRPASEPRNTEIDNE